MGFVSTMVLLSILKRDSITRQIFNTYYHPKKVLITNGILNREIKSIIGKDDVYEKHKLLMLGILCILMAVR
jgi:hypothetical protein